MSAEALEVERPNEQEEVVIPELSAEQKNQILLLQRQIQNTQLQIMSLEKQLGQLTPGLNLLLNKVASDMKIDVNAYTFDLDNLRLIPKAK